MLFRLFLLRSLKKNFGRCGNNVHINRGFHGAGLGNVEIGSDVYIGDNACFLTTRAKIVIGNHVMFGPNVSIVTGNHSTNIVGKYMTNVTDGDKSKTDDADVVFEGDNWIGINATILKGVTIGRGSVIGANALVNSDVPLYAIVGGFPQKC